MFINKLDLLHDISIRANVNKMDAYNLAIVFTPNLIKSSNPLKDVQMCTMASDTGGPTVATVIMWCIQHYFEIFDEVQDRAEAIPLSKSALSKAGEQVSDNDNNAALVMPVRPSSPPRVSSNSRLPPSAWTNSANNVRDLPYQPHQPHRRLPSSHHDYVLGPTSPSSSVFSGAAIRSVATGGTQAPFPSISKSRSVISIEKETGPTMAGGTRKGSIQLGTITSKGTIGKSAGAAVEALSITAEGFFTPPAGGKTSNHTFR
ncbi:MAG TPA: RhoGAP domain-containing protein [Chlamydiales bacterium]|jgi:Rho GTPase-activating protein 1|nr:RhoGAP domain-containing protein [Chlamydiales bacterium]